MSLLALCEYEIKTGSEDAAWRRIEKTLTLAIQTIYRSEGGGKL